MIATAGATFRVIRSERPAPFTLNKNGGTDSAKSTEPDNVLL